MQRETLARLIAAFGADPVRWPTGTGSGLDALLASDGDARRLLDEARRLDAAINRAAAHEPAVRPGLEDRIVAAAVAERASLSSSKGRTGGAVVPLRAPARAKTPPAAAARPRIWRSASAGALAASLVMGFMLGLSDLGPAGQITALVEQRAPVEETALVQQGDALSLTVEELL